MKACDLCGNDLPVDQGAICDRCIDALHADRCAEWWAWTDEGGAA